MRKLVAVRVVDDGEGFRIFGYVSRGKNRQEVWSFKHPNRVHAEIMAVVEGKEEMRESVEGTRPVVPYLQGG